MTWNYLHQLDKEGSYLIGAQTNDPSATGSKNSYGVSNKHAFSVISVFDLRDFMGIQKYRLYMIRNPWSATSYSGAFKSSDPLWS